MKFFELIPAGTNIKFIQHRWRFITLSIIALAITFGAMVYNQVTTGSFLNFGIDFAGGSQVRLALDPEKDPGIDRIREALEDLGYQGSSAVEVPDQAHEVMVRVKEVISIDEETIERCRAAAETVPGVKAETAKLVHFNHPEGGSKLFLRYDAEPRYDAVQQAISGAGCEGTADQGFGGQEGEFPVDFALIGIGSKLQEQFDEVFGQGTVTEIVRSESVGAKVGGQLKQDGAKAMLYAIGFIFLFVMIRYDLRFAPGGIVALTHDALLMVGAFAVTGKEFNLQTIAAVLTVIGYSINDTIVVFDRIRERVALDRDAPLPEITNTALNETLSRTILTTGTTLIVVLSTYILGSGAIKDFAFALIVGMLVGTYSSLYIATPVFLWVNKRFYGGQGHLQWLDDQEREGTGKLLRGAPVAEEGVPEVVTASTEDAEGDDEGDESTPRKTTRRRRRRPRSSEE